MTWFRIDDKFHDHRKVRALGKSRPGAVGLWTLCGTWSADNTSDGFVPDQIVARWDARKRLAATLCRVGLWHEVEINGEHGYQFHQWEEHQPTREQVLHRRQVRADAGRLGGVKSGQTRRSKNEALASPLAEPPTRPVPLADANTPMGAALVGDARENGPAPSGPGAVDAMTFVASRIGEHITTGTRTSLAFQVQKLRREHVADTEIGEALVRWLQRTGVGPGILPSLIDDIRKEARGATTRPPTVGPAVNGTDAHFAALLAGTNGGPQLRALPGGA